MYCLYTYYRSVTGDAVCCADDLECCSVQSVYLYYRSVTGDAVCCTDDLECCSVVCIIVGV